MRLIDADELMALLRVRKNIGIGTDIEEIPTVKAIPIEWIKEWYKKALSKSGFMGDEMVSVEDLLEDWEKENEHK